MDAILLSLLIIYAHLLHMLHCRYRPLPARGAGCLRDDLAYSGISWRNCKET